MNLHAPNSVETETELRLLSSIENHIISTQSNKANIVIVQDGLLGAYLMSKYEEDIDKESFMMMLNSIDGFEMDIFYKKYERYREKTGRDEFTGRLLFSMLLPEDFSYRHSDVVIDQGILLRGNITKTQLGTSHYSFIVLFYNEYSPQKSIEFINNVQFLSCAFLNYHGFSIGIKDCMISDEAIEKIRQSNYKLFIEANAYDETIKNPNIREMYITNILSNARDKGMKIAKEDLQSDNNFLSTVMSGSKGDYFNIAQIMGLLGQQNFQGQRMPVVLNNDTRTLPHYPMDIMNTGSIKKYQSRGFIENSFLRGLDPREFWFHSVSGREGITDTAMKTATSGYIQRRMVKVAEDVQIKYDGTVRNSAGSILQFRYGNMGLNPDNSVILNNEMTFCDVSRLVDKMNYKYENKLNECK